MLFEMIENNRIWPQTMKSQALTAQETNTFRDMTNTHTHTHTQTKQSTPARPTAFRLLSTRQRTLMSSGSQHPLHCETNTFRGQVMTLFISDVCVCSLKHPGGFMLLLTFGQSVGSAELARCSTDPDSFRHFTPLPTFHRLHSAFTP